MTKPYFCFNVNVANIPQNPERDNNPSCYDVS